MGPFLKKVLILFALLVVAIVVLSLVSGDGGTLPFLYEGTH
jgi:hypothetical protein